MLASRFFNRNGFVMKITFVTDTYSPQANGVATTLERLVNGLRERGHTVDVVRPAVLACDEEGQIGRAHV